jgi:hypothetical protein
MILFEKKIFDLKVKGQGPMKVITVRDTPPYGHAPTYQLSLTYLERQKCYGPDKKILFKKQLFYTISSSTFQIDSTKWIFCCTVLPCTVSSNYVSPSNEGRHIVLVWFFLPLLLLLPLLLSEACPDHNFFVFRDRSMIFGMWMHDHKAVCRVP